MAAIVLVHPIHGAKVACSEAEAEYDSLSGWTRYKEPTDCAPADVSPVVVENVNALAPVKRRGRPPRSVN